MDFWWVWMFKSLGGGVRPAGRVSCGGTRKIAKRHQVAAQDERFAIIFAAPGPHFTGAANAGGRQSSQRRGWIWDWFPVYHRCR